MGMYLVLLGAPGAGKGTQAQRLSAELEIPTISTGNILRAAIKDQTPLGIQIESLMGGGKLIPDEIIMEIIAVRLTEPDCVNGFILDGIPRTIGQAEALEHLGIPINHVMSIEISDEEVERRMSGRRVCTGCGASYHIVANPSKLEGICDTCGASLMQREDDAPETVRTRLKIYHEATSPLKAFYAERNVLSSVENQSDIGAVTASILAALRG